jgi:uncharacterized protein (TIGR03435 family)
MNRNLILTALAVIPALLSAQQVSGTPAFEVMNIKPSDPSVMKMGKGRMLPGGRIEVPGYTLRELIVFSYGVTDDMISGGPKWANEDRFDIIAKAPTDASDQALRLMMQSLLSERFRMAFHREDRPMSVFVLTVSKSVGALKPASGTQSQCMWTSAENGFRRRECHNITMDEFAKQLPHTGGIGIDLPVVDGTALKGNYDFQFEVGTIPNGGSIVDSSGPTIFEALTKIGLKLESRKVPMPAIVIDQAEMPTGN